MTSTSPIVLLQSTITVPRVLRSKFLKIGDRWRKWTPSLLILGVLAELRWGPKRTLHVRLYHLCYFKFRLILHYTLDIVYQQRQVDFDVSDSEDKTPTPPRDPERTLQEDLFKTPTNSQSQGLNIFEEVRKSLDRTELMLKRCNTPKNENQLSTGNQSHQVNPLFVCLKNILCFSFDCNWWFKKFFF